MRCGGSPGRPQGRGGGPGRASLPRSGRRLPRRQQDVQLLGVLSHGTSLRPCVAFGNLPCRYGELDRMDDPALAAVGPRLRALRTERELTLAEVAEATGISTSTLSRLESGARKPTLELLLPLARTYLVALDDFVEGPAAGDPRVHLKPVQAHGQTILSDPRAGGVQAFKHVIPAGRPNEPRPRRRTRATSGSTCWTAGCGSSSARSTSCWSRRGGGVRHPHAALVRLRGRPRGGVPQPVRPAGRAGPPAGGAPPPYLTLTAAPPAAETAAAAPGGTAPRWGA